MGKHLATVVKKNVGRNPMSRWAPSALIGSVERKRERERDGERKVWEEISRCIAIVIITAIEELLLLYRT